MSGAAETSSPLGSPNDDAVSATGGFSVRPGEASDAALALARQAAVARDAGDMDASWSLVQAAMNADPKSEAIQRLYRFAEADHRRYADTKVYMGRSKDALQAGRGEEAVAWMQKAAERSGSATVRAILEQTKTEAARMGSRPAREPTRHQGSRPLGAVGLALIAVGVGAFLVLEARREQDRIREMVEVIGPGGLVVASGALFALSMIPPTRAVMTIRSVPAAVQQAEAAQALAPAVALSGYALSKTQRSPGETPPESSGDRKGASSSLRKPAANDPELQSLIDRLFQPSDQLPGGTAGAIRNEALTGAPTKGHWHLQKGQEHLNTLNRILRRTDLGAADRATAEALREELRNAINLWMQTRR